MARKYTPKQYQAPRLCQGKRRYASEKEAEQIAHEQELINFGQGLVLHVYRCHLCGGWHLTRSEETNDSRQSA